MSNPNRVAGQARVKIDGVSYPTAGETSLEIGGKSREAVPGDYDTSSFKESEVPSKIEVTVLYKSSVDLAALRSIDNATVTVELDNGHTWIVRNAYASEPPSFSQDGKAKVTLQGPPAELML